jgi:hypothetical protein
LFFIHLPKQLPAQKNTTSSYKTQTISYKLIEAKNHTYGFNVFVNDTLFIHQPVIPCIAGNKGFKTKADAKKIAVLVIQKIRNKIIPPSVSMTEMKKLGVSL